MGRPGLDRPRPAGSPAATPAPRVPNGSGPSLYEQPVLLVSQKTKLIELTNEYAVFDGQGQQIGAVVQGGRAG